MTPGTTDELEERLRAAFGRRAATTTVAPEPPPVERPRTAGAALFRSPPTTTGDWRRPGLATVAAAVVIGAGLVGGHVLLTDSARVATNGTPAATGEIQAELAPACGPDLPIAFPMPAGFAPRPGGDGRHWVDGDTTIDVRWPAETLLDLSTPYDSATTSVAEEKARRLADGRTARTAMFTSGSLGAAACATLDVTVATPDLATTERALDRIEVALVGPGGPLAGPPQDLVATTSSATAWPAAGPCPGSGTVDDNTVESTGPLPDPRTALAHFLPTEPRLPQSDYEEVIRPDGSRAYMIRGDEGAPSVIVVIRAEQRPDGWWITWWESSGC